MAMKSLWILVNFLFLKGYHSSEIGRNGAALLVEKAITRTTKNSSQTLPYEVDSWLPWAGTNPEEKNKVRHAYGEDATARESADSERHLAIRVKRVRDSEGRNEVSHLEEEDESARTETDNEPHSFNRFKLECKVKNGGCKQICEINTKGKPTCACRHGFVLHPDDHDCKEEHSEGKIVHFNSLAHPNGSLIFSWKWRGDTVPSHLSGFYFKATAPDHTFQISLPPISTNFTTDQLRVYTEYDITLWPFYKSREDSDQKLGKPLTLSVHTPASDPTAPAAVTPWPESTWLGPAEVILTIDGPVAWNCKPVGYRLRMEPTDAANRNHRIVKFSEFTPNAEISKYTLNVTLSLKPGLSYTVFVSAFGLGDLGETLVGPETSVTFGTIPSAPVNLCAKISDPTTALLEWESPSPATSFEVIVNTQYNRQGSATEELTTTSILNSSAAITNTTNLNWHSSQEQDVVLEDDGEIVPNNHKASSSMVSRDPGSNIPSAILWLNGHNVSSSNYSLPLFDLTPYTVYDVHVRACAADTCSETTSTTFRTSPSSIPTATITRIFSNSTSSIQVEWSFPRSEESRDFGLLFEVHVVNGYGNTVSGIIRTTKMALTISNLDSGTRFYVLVRSSLEVAPGRRIYSKPARATVSTWPAVPLQPTLSAKGYKNSPDVVAVAWVFVNSTVTHVQVATNSSDFADCEALSNCNIVVLRGSNSSFKAGFGKISGLNPYETYAVNLRGCNDHGCGKSTRILLTTGISVPSEPLDLQLRYSAVHTAKLDWKPPLQPAGPLTGYKVTSECGNRSAQTVELSTPGYGYSGLTYLPECSFSVSAFNVGDDGETLYGNPATIPPSGHITR